ncbi:GntR family transcriptional regulator [Tistlia consotensis]|nr:GntR family transcriptional regulator [Tistlia consotensis]
MPEATESEGGAGPLSDRVYLVIKTMIEAGHIRSGEKLLEAQVVKAFGVSRSPARNALRRLQRDGLIETETGRGFRVAGDADPRCDGKPAVLDSVRIAVPRHWERMYAAVEKEINIQVLFGSVQIVETELANHFGVSRTVTRDVLARMHSVGLITKGASGRWIAEHISPERIRELFEVRSILEPQALLRAAPFISKQELAAAQHNIDAARSRPTIESADFDRTESDMHIHLLAHCPNREILLALNRTHMLFAPTRHLGDPFLGVPMELIRAALDEHSAVIQNVLSGRLTDACAHLVDHIEKAHGRWLRRLDICAHIAQIESPPYLSKLD